MDWKGIERNLCLYGQTKGGSEIEKAAANRLRQKLDEAGGGKRGKEIDRVAMGNKAWKHKKRKTYYDKDLSRAYAHFRSI